MVEYCGSSKAGLGTSMRWNTQILPGCCFVLKPLIAFRYSHSVPDRYGVPSAFNSKSAGIGVPMRDQRMTTTKSQSSGLGSPWAMACCGVKPASIATAAPGWSHATISHNIRPRNRRSPLMWSMASRASLRSNDTSPGEARKIRNCFKRLASVIQRSQHQRVTYSVFSINYSIFS